MACTTDGDCGAGTTCELGPACDSTCQNTCGDGADNAIEDCDNPGRLVCSDDTTVPCEECVDGINNGDPCFDDADQTACEAGGGTCQADDTNCAGLCTVACKDDCSISECGDEVVEGDEECDPPHGVCADDDSTSCTVADNTPSGNGGCPGVCATDICTEGANLGAACTADADCGFAQCNDNVGCDSDCQDTCGNGVVDDTAPDTGEVCDPGGECSDGSGCEEDADCTTGTCSDEAGELFCGSVVCIDNPDPIEDVFCDNSHLTSDCSSDCSERTRGECSLCGDKVLEGKETCDPPDGFCMDAYVDPDDPNDASLIPCLGTADQTCPGLGINPPGSMCVAGVCNMLMEIACSDTGDCADIGDTQVGAGTCNPGTGFCEGVVITCSDDDICEADTPGSMCSVNSLCDADCMANVCGDGIVSSMPFADGNSGSRTSRKPSIQL